MAALEAQLEGLKRQARQATRYRNLSDHIRRAPITLQPKHMTDDRNQRCPRYVLLFAQIASKGGRHVENRKQPVGDA